MPTTIQDVIDNIMSAVPGERLAETVDTFKAVDPAAPCAGIVTTFMATRQVLARAVELGANLVITHEPIYYGHRDETGWLEGLPTFEAKRRFIEESGLTIWRFHDYWHRHEPDGILAGAVERLGWGGYQDATTPFRFAIPETPLSELAATVKARLGSRVLRVTGRPEMACTRVALAPGSVGAGPQIQALAIPDVQVLVVGESTEWSTCEYVRDALEAGLEKALIQAGHCNSEEPGMAYLADWLRPRLDGVTVTHVPAGDPFWTL